MIQSEVMEILMKLRALILSFGFFSSFLVYSSELSLQELLEVNLSTGSFLEIDIQHSPINLTIIDEEKIRHSGARHLSELLEIYVPGFQYM